MTKCHSPLSPLSFQVEGPAKDRLPLEDMLDSQFLALKHLWLNRRLTLRRRRGCLMATLNLDCTPTLSDQSQIACKFLCISSSRKGLDTVFAVSHVKNSHLEAT